MTEGWSRDPEERSRQLVAAACRTGPGDREAFEAAARQCYRDAGLAWPDRLLWVRSPVGVAIGGPVAAVVVEHVEHPDRGVPARPPERWSGFTVERGAGDRITRRARERAGLRSRWSGPSPLVDAVTESTARAIGDWADPIDDDVLAGVLARVTLELGWNPMTEEVRSALSATWRRSWDQWLGPDVWTDGWVRRLDAGEPATSVPLEPYERAALSAGAWWAHEQVVVACDHPVELHVEVVDDPTLGGVAVRPHREDGPAAVWADGWRLHAVHGVVVPERAVEAPETLTSYDVFDAEDEAERRVLIDRIGVRRFLDGCWTELLDDDPVFGRLWRLPDPRGRSREPMVLVEVVNATPEPDGSSRTHLLRVPPAMTTARYAVAWTFGLQPDEYAPDVQT